MKLLQALPLNLKIAKTQNRIREWYNYYGGEVYVSFSGGKDSTVLLDIVRGLYPDIDAVYVDTGLEYPELRDFVKTIDNVTWLKPKKNFKSVIQEYGYPIVSKEVAIRFMVRNLEIQGGSNFMVHTLIIIPASYLRIIIIRNGSICLMLTSRYQISVVQL